MTVDHVHGLGCICHAEGLPLEGVRTLRGEISKEFELNKGKIDAVRLLGELHPDLQAKLDDANLKMSLYPGVLDKLDNLILKLEAERN